MDTERDEHEPNGCAECAGLRELNADLLAAAREIEAVAARWCYPQPDKPQSSWAKLERLRAAIARAEGRTTTES